MKHTSLSIFLILCSLITGCSAFDTFNKYANARFYTIYNSGGVGACDFKPKFNDCADREYFDVKISDDNNSLALAKYINQSSHVSYFGFTRDGFASQTKPIRDFLIWSKENHAEDKKITMKRPAGNVAGYLFEKSEVEYTFQYIHTRAGVSMLVINSGGGDYYGFTYNEAVKLLNLIDSWYDSSFSEKKIY
ncbi:TPA: hypothetical protein ACGCBI_000500 [Serratia marcescens]